MGAEIINGKAERIKAKSLTIIPPKPTMDRDSPVRSKIRFSIILTPFSQIII